MEKSLNNMSAGELREKLTAKQLCFANALIEGSDPKSAAIRAGYSEKSAAVQAAKLLKNEKIAAYRQAKAAELSTEDGISQGWVKRKLAEVAERCMEPTPHMVWDKSSQSYVHDGTWDFDADGAIKALSAIGKLDMLSEQPKTKEELQSVEAFLEQLEGGRSF